MRRFALSLLTALSLHAMALEGLWEMDANYSIAQTKDDFVKILLSLMAEHPQKLQFDTNGTVRLFREDGLSEKGRYFLEKDRLRLRFGPKVREGTLLYPDKLYLNYPLSNETFRLYFTNRKLTSRTLQKRESEERNVTRKTNEQNRTKRCNSVVKKRKAKKRLSGFPLIKDRLYRSIQKVGGNYIFALFSSGGHFSWIALPSPSAPAKKALRHQERYFYRGGKVLLESDGHRIVVRNRNRFSLLMSDRRVDFRRY